MQRSRTTGRTEPCSAEVCITELLSAHQLMLSMTSVWHELNYVLVVSWNEIRFLSAIHWHHQRKSHFHPYFSSTQCGYHCKIQSTSILRVILLSPLLCLNPERLQTDVFEKDTYRQDFIKKVRVQTHNSNSNLLLFSSSSSHSWTLAGCGGCGSNHVIKCCRRSRERNSVSDWSMSRCNSF